MSFTFEARTLLELGKELISTDEVAIYELIKNSVDAGSENVEILVNVLLTHSDYKEAIARIEEEGRSRADVLTYVQSCLISETDPGAVGMMQALGRGKIRPHRQRHPHHHFDFAERLDGRKIL